MRAAVQPSQGQEAVQLQAAESFDGTSQGPYNGDVSIRVLPPSGSACGGDPVSTGVETRGMHAELH